MTELELTSVEKHVENGLMSNIRWPKSLYIEFGKRLHRYEELICVSGYATYIRGQFLRRGMVELSRYVEKDKGEGFKKLEKRGLLRDTMGVVVENPQFLLKIL